ncbi:O-antigen/teichoic acid export membrane protein [Parvularcula dongshanensis]|uniref:O-antigen/teichoic acid export membrane protein n=1 Tax=Parvularcula dongshanensis TaxID=1173995 RepID=A0A840I513_9PROT|nr:lipopolysaccharide biosynthesis protein [Parvularcula dongshanensis]MBB4659294.1 O-antigen/teichoic acid export membrane protein [Parvularcula dongshanensis]
MSAGRAERLPGSTGMGRRVRRNTGLMVGAKIGGGVLSLGALAVATRALTPAEFGTLVFVHALVLVFTEAVTFESWLTVVRFGAEAKAAKDDERYARTVRFCATLDAVAAAAAFSLAVLVCSLSVEASGALSVLPLPVLLSYLTLILFKQTSASLGVLRLSGRFAVLAAQSVVISTLRLVGGLVVLFLGGGLIGFLCAWYAASLTSYLILMVLGWRALGEDGDRALVFSGGPTLKAPAEGVWKFAWLTNLDASLGSGTTQLPLVLTGIAGGAHASALFKVGQEVASILSKSTKAIDRVIYPELATLTARGEGGRVVGVVLRTGAALLAFGGALSLAFGIAGPPLLAGLLGRPIYAEAATISVLLLLAAALGGAVAPLFPAFYATGHPGKPLIARAAGLVTLLAAFFPLTGRFGVEGAGLALLASSLATVAVAVLLARGHAWQGAGGQAAGQTFDKASFAAAATSPTEAERSGTPGHPTSRFSLPAKARGVS